MWWKIPVGILLFLLVCLPTSLLFSGVQELWRTWKGKRVNVKGLDESHRDDRKQMDIQPGPEETELVEQWERRDGRFVAGATGDRIHRLTTEYLTFVRVSPNGWERLFRDPHDGRYWELTFPRGEMHGGGPRALRVISEEEVSRKYSG